MAQQENLTEENLNDLQKTFDEKIAPTNRDATFKTFVMSDKDRQRILEENVASLELQVSELTGYIKSIFDGHVLIDGQFVKIDKPEHFEVIRAILFEWYELKFPNNDL